MYIYDFIKNLFKPHRLGSLVYLLLNVAILYLVFGNGMPINLIWIIGAYLVSLVIALSPVGEFFLRLSYGARVIKRPDYKARIEPLFETVYKSEYPNISPNIKIYYKKDPSANAFALGRNTIVLHSGLLDASDEMIKGILAHEFAHIQNKDTDFILFTYVGNLILLPAIVVYQIFVFAALFCVALIIRSEFIMKALGFILNIPLILWQKLGNILVLMTSRLSEYKADAFAVDMGVGKELAEALDALHAKEVEPGYFAGLASTHPRSDDRIAKILEAIETSNT
ncbi:MAG: M48 family metalloprotease [Spirochaetia bacterium]